MTAKKTSTSQKASRGKTARPKSSGPVAKQRPSRPFHIVGMGASAGGVEALREFFRQLPSESGMAFIVVQHLSRDKKSLLADLLAQCTSMPVKQIEDGMPVEPNRVYVVPPNADLLLENGHLSLVEPQLTEKLHQPINRFFRSLAEDQRENSIALILSGTGSDGTFGIKAIKAEGGLVIVQDEASAKYPGMPHSAIVSGMADLILPLQEIPKRLIAYCGRAKELLPDQPAQVKIDQLLPQIIKVIRRETGHDFSGYKTSTFARRISRRMAVNGLNTPNDYLQRLTKQSDEAAALVQDLLINVTRFFRDPDAFEALQRRVITPLVGDHAGDEPIKVWIPGCATGEEAYSVAILFREAMSKLKRNDLKVQIFATDLDEEAINQARKGRFPQNLKEDIAPNLLTSYFRNIDNAYQLTGQVREMIIFSQHDLAHNPPFCKLDLICCRNLLIYIDASVQKKILPLFHYALKPQGVLFLGPSETIGAFATLFEPIEKKWKIYRRQEQVQPLTIDFPFSPFEYQPTALDPVPTPPLLQASIGDLAEKALSLRYSPPSVVINENFEVVHSTSQTNPYLELPKGAPSMNILKLAREELQPALRAMVRQAFASGEIHIHQHLKVRINNRTEALNLIVEPLKLKTSGPKMALVIFEPVALRETTDETSPDSASDKTSISQEQITKQLEEELRVTSEELRISIEELEASNEELKTSNEELMSMNEELQSTNEEVESSKEELQALNEELTTVNSELESKVDELAEANDDMQNLLNSSQIATIFLDRELRIKRFTAPAAEIYHLIPSDVGRPFQHLASILDYPTINQDIGRVLKSLKSLEKEVQSQEQHWFLVRILPYRTIDDVIDGVVLTLVDITENKQSQDDLLISEKRLHALVEATSDVIYCMSPDWSEMYHLLSEEFLTTTSEPNRNWLQDYIPEDEQPLLLAAIQSSIQLKKPFELEHRIRKKNGGIGWTSSRAVPLLNSQGEIKEWFGMAKDITLRKQTEMELVQSEERFRQLANAMPQLVWTALPDGTVDYLNNRHEEFKGLKQRSDGTWEWGALIHPDDLERTLTAWHQALQSGQPHQVEGRVLCADGSYRWQLTLAVPVRKEDGQIYKWFGSMTDIEDLKQTEQALAKARKTAEKAVQAKREFLAKMTHEIRTPMTVIFGALQHLDKTKLSKADARCIELAEKAGNNLLEIIGDVLDFSKIDAGRMELAKNPFDPRSCLKETAALFSSAAEKKGLELKLKVSERVPEMLLGDEPRLRQVLTNLIGNAIKFTEQGKITVTATRLSSTDAEKIPEGQLLFSVMDTGCGIPGDKINALFKSFCQIDSTETRSVDGTGLGLAICRGIVKKMGGTIWVESEVGKGSEFFFTLPILSERRAKERAVDLADGCAAPSPGKVRNILLAEDDPALQEVLKVLLDRPEWHVEIVDNGAAAVAAWKQGQFDIILMDIQMPGMDGIEATREIRRQEPEGHQIPIVALTAQSRRETHESCLEAGMDAVLIKPIRGDKMQQVIEQLCR